MKIEDAKGKLEFLKDTYITSAVGTDEHRDYYSNLAIACELGAEAIEKQIPKQVDFIGVVVAGLYNGECPECFKEVRSNMNFCPNCGCAIRRK
jgi:hypothetical protein